MYCTGKFILWPSTIKSGRPAEHQHLLGGWVGASFISFCFLSFVVRLSATLNKDFASSSPWHTQTFYLCVFLSVVSDCREFYKREKERGDALSVLYCCCYNRLKKSCNLRNDDDDDDAIHIQLQRGNRLNLTFVRACVLSFFLFLKGYFLLKLRDRERKDKRQVCSVRRSSVITSSLHSLVIRKRRRFESSVCTVH